MDVSKLEPADRDPVKLRNTALSLFVFMILGGFAILLAYKNFGERTAQSDRPSMEFKITDDVDVMRADREIVNVQTLKGKVALALITTSKPDVRSEPTLAAVRDVMARFKDQKEKPVILAFVIDADESNPESMAPVLNEFGSEPDLWRIAAGKDGKVSIRAFLKYRLRFGVYPERIDGEYVYDSKLVLLDQHLQVRGLPGSNEGWDFEKVAQMEEKYSQALKQHPDKELVPPPITTDQLRELLFKSIDYLYAHPDEKGQAQ